MNVRPRIPRPARRPATLVLSAAAAFLPVAAAAQQASDEPPAATRAEAPPSSFALGIGFASRQRPYEGAKRDNMAIPLVFWDTRWVNVAGSGLEVKLAKADLSPSQRLSAGLRLSYQRDGYGASDSPALAGMQTRKAGVWGGAGITWTTPLVQVDTAWLADLSGHSKGQELQVQAQHRFAWNRFGSTPKLQAQWRDSKAVDYYFGVRAQEALPGRPEYHGTAAATVGAGLRLDYIASPHHSMFIDLGITHLPGEITRSPIVGRSDTSQVAVGYLYRF